MADPTLTAAKVNPPAFDPLGPLEPGVTLLEASAGTGKTYSITSLYIRLVIEENIPVDQILAVTFTQAATAELTSRIRKRLGEAHRVLHDNARKDVIASDDIVLRHLAAKANSADATVWAQRARAAVESFDRANITTIHGFCQRMLSQHALEAQVPFGVELIEDQAQLVQEIADDFWVREVARSQPWELQTLATIGVDLESMRRLARMAIHNWDARPVPEPPTTVARPDAAALVEALALASEAARHAHTKADIEALQETIRDVNGFTPGGAWKQLPRALDNLAQNRVIGRDLETLAVLHRDNLRANLPTQQLPLIVDAVTRLLAAHARWRPQALPWGLALRHALVREVRAQHQKRTRERGVWSYDDLLRSLKDALTSTTRPHIAKALQAAIGRRFRAVLIDEFQDTDPVQWAIFQTVFANRHHHLYLIGDPKQAIYGFRRADVMTYLEAGAKADFVYTLETNYRSDGPLIAALNHLFLRKNPERVFAVDGIPYRPVKAKYDSRVAGMTDAPVRLLWVARTKQNTARSRDFATSKITGKWGEDHLPGYVASDIVHTLKSGITIAGEGGVMRPLAPSDLAVLVHKNDHAVRVQDALRQAGVPAVVHGPRSVFETDEAADLLRVLTAVLDPSRMQNVRAALLTRLLGVTARELARMEQEASRELEAAIDRLREWREAWTKRSFIEAFRKLTSARVDELLALEDGERRLANHLQLGELLHLAVAQRDLKPPGLVAWLERQIQRADKTDDRQQVRLETDEPAVQVVTIHKAKGLEYAFVWAPFLWQKADQTFPGKRIPDFVFRDAERDPERKPCLEIGLSDQDPLRQRAHRLQIFGEQSERLRSFYVALTRAKHQVTLYGGAFWDLPDSPLGYILLSNANAHDADSLRRESSALTGVFRLNDTDLIANIGNSDNLPRDLFTVAIAARPDGARYEPGDDPEPLTIRVWDDRQLDVGWRRTSFSGLIQESGPYVEALQEERLQAASDEDKIEIEDLFLPATNAGDVVLADMPSGRAIGNCIHKILELADFTDPTTVAAHVTSELVHFAVDPVHAPALTSALQALLATPLDASGLRLDQLPKARRLPEMNFVFPVAGGYRVTPSPPEATTDFAHRNLLKTFRAFGPPALESWLTRFEAVPFASVRGFLSGSLDLAFQSPHDGRWYIVDWKSNHLGRSARDYSPKKLREAMDHHHYHLQYHLYSVALCRYLRSRLPGFDLTRDFGGAFYLFLRGMHPAHPPGTGIYYDRPTPSLMHELERQLDGIGDARRGQLALI